MVLVGAGRQVQQARQDANIYGKSEGPDRHFHSALSPTFQWTDEFYYVDHVAEGLHVLLAGDLVHLDDPGKEKYPGKKFGDEFPLAWRHQLDGGREWYTALGHQKEHYSDPMFTRHLLGGILWAAGLDAGTSNR